MLFRSKPESRYGPLSKFKEDDKILKGFIWKPKDRPVSKESVIPSYNKRKAAAEKSAAAKSKTGKPPLKVAPGAKEKTGKDSTANKTPGKLPPLKTGQDSTLKRDSTLKSRPRKPTKKDSLTANLDIKK